MLLLVYLTFFIIAFKSSELSSIKKRNERTVLVSHYSVKPLGMISSADFNKVERERGRNQNRLGSFYVQ